MRRKIEISLFLACLLVLPNCLAKHLTWWFSLNSLSKHAHYDGSQHTIYHSCLGKVICFLSLSCFLPPKHLLQGMLKLGELENCGVCWAQTYLLLFLSPPQPPSLGSHHLPAWLSLIYISPVDNRDGVYSIWMNPPGAANLFPLLE